jgi:hypothetical protein
MPSRDRSQLLQHRVHVDDAPALMGEPVVSEPDDVDELHLHVLAGGRHAHELTLMRSGRANARDDVRAFAARDALSRPVSVRAVPDALVCEDVEGRSRWRAWGEPRLD